MTEICYKSFKFLKIILRVIHWIAVADNTFDCSDIKGTGIFILL